MAYKTCENCGSRIFEHGCVNCDEMEYISMQEEYEPVSSRLDAPVRLKTAGEFRIGQEVRKGNKIGNILEVVDNKTVKVDYGLYIKTENSFELETVD